MAVTHLIYLCVILSSTLAIKLKPRIHGGEPAEPGQFPYIVSLRIEVQFIHHHFCGGGLLSDHWIISAAHCFQNGERTKENVWAVVGAHHSWSDGRKYKLKRIVIHPEFEPALRMNNICLLQTNSPIPLTPNVQPIPVSTAWVQPDEEGILAGWGHSEVILIKITIRNNSSRDFYFIF